MRFSWYYFHEDARKLLAKRLNMLWLKSQDIFKSPLYAPTICHPLNFEQQKRSLRCFLSPFRFGFSFLAGELPPPKWPYRMGTEPTQKSRENGKKMENGPRTPKWDFGHFWGHFFLFDGHFSAISVLGPFSISFPFSRIFVWVRFPILYMATLIATIFFHPKLTWPKLTPGNLRSASIVSIHCSHKFLMYL